MRTKGPDELLWERTELADEWRRDAYEYEVERWLPDEDDEDDEL